MKRYRVFLFDFDSRAIYLEPAGEHWDEKMKKQHIENQEIIVSSIKSEFGEQDIESKLSNLMAIGTKPFSVLSFHNLFLEQIRKSFIINSYYTALVGVCALGERVLNHLILELRNYFKNSTEYESVKAKQTFDNWFLMVDTLDKWEVLLPGVREKFILLKKLRNKSVHFNLETNNDIREEALNSIKIMQEIIELQFSVFKHQPWIIYDIPGEIYIKKEFENNPFVKQFILPNCLYVGYKHEVKCIQPTWLINDSFNYEKKEIDDKEYCELRKSVH